jgi:hypothetical protein
MAGIFASHPGKAVMKDAAIEVSANDPFDIRAQKTVMFGKTVLINLFKSLKMIFNTLIISRFLWISRAIYEKSGMFSMQKVKDTQTKHECQEWSEYPFGHSFVSSRSTACIRRWMTQWLKIRE